MSEGTLASVAVITGASSGIGAAVASRLSRLQRHLLVLVARDGLRLAGVAASCRANGGPEIVAVAADVATPEGRAALFGAADRAGRLDLLVNNAGIGLFGPTESFTEEQWDRLLAVNLSAVFHLARGAAQRMRGRGGTIVNIGSDADRTGFPEAAAYCATKGGLLLLSRALREELRPQGIRVSVISPGRVDTRFNAKEPGMRPGALSADDVAEAVEFAATCSPAIELQELRLDSMNR